MPSDGIMISALVKELSDTIIGGKVDKIFQPEKDELILNIRNNGNYKLLLSANPAAARMHLTNVSKENPLSAPNFCMLLRKYLIPSKIISVEQKGFERVVELTFECTTEMFDVTQKKLIVEIMGHCSNIILTDAEYLIHDAIRQVDYATSSKRQILPGIYYKRPPEQNKLSLLEDELYETDFDSEQKSDKYLLAKYQGFSPLIAKEITFRSTGEQSVPLCEFSGEQRDEFTEQLKKLKDSLKRKIFNSCFISDVDVFYCLPLQQYSASFPAVSTDSCSETLDLFYIRKDEFEHTKRITADIFKILSNTQSRLFRKIENQRAELAESENSYRFKLFGDMITTEIYKIRPGMKSALLTDYSVSPPQKTSVPLDERLSPSQNAQQYYKKYKKAQSAKSVLTTQIGDAEQELIYIDSVLEEISRVKNRTEAEEVRKELIQCGYLKERTSKQKKIKAINRGRESSNLEKIISSDGFTVYYGKNNIQNDFLTLKFAGKNDIWFHVKNYPGSHVVVFSEGRKVPDSTLMEAAILAAANSKAKGKNVAVDYTEIRHVKKPSGARPGMVVYTDYKTAYVDADKNE